MATKRPRVTRRLVSIIILSAGDIVNISRLIGHDLDNHPVGKANDLLGGQTYPAGAYANLVRAVRLGDLYAAIFSDNKIVPLPPAQAKLLVITRPQANGLDELAVFIYLGVPFTGIREKRGI